MIERALGISYLRARELAARYDAQRGKPKRVIRKPPTEAEAGESRIPARDLRNNAAGILRQVEKGKRFVITVSGRAIAELAPISTRAVFVPRSVVERMIHTVPLDSQFEADIESVLDERIDEV